ncbi:MAG: amino acid adenylation domain-containing protein, partial [Bacteroidales bacterium]|nr:amino acid adenylation domain-containing protein [Bacteroidales bacterium]
IHKEIGVEFPLRDVFLHSTIKSQASQIATSTKKEFVSISKAKEQSNYPVSSAQKRLYLLQQFDLTSTAYNMSYIIPLGKEADKSKIEEVFKQLINRHESFRTSIILVDQKPVQVICKDVDFELEEINIESTELENTRNKFIKPFDLSKAPFLRVTIVEIKGEDSLLMLDMHHIISDAISQAILEKEFQALFTGKELAPLPLQYKDYSQWQNSIEQQEHVKEQEQYWLNQFEEEIPVLNLPTDYVRPLIQSNEGAKVSFALSKEETGGIKTFTKENDLTLYMSLLSAFSILLTKLSGQDDIIIGTPIAGRNHAELDNIVGMFVNTLPMRNKVKGEETIQEFVSNLKQTVLGAYENQNYQFEDLVDKISVGRDTSRNPIFDVMISLLNRAEHSGDITEINNENFIHIKGVSKFDLSLNAIEFGEQLLISFEYCTQLFKAETIDRFIAYFKKIVNQITGNVEMQISNIEILTEAEKHFLLYDFNNTKADYPKEKTIHQLFEEQVERTPSAVAVITKNGEITYGELNERSNLLANTLLDKGCSLKQLVGILAERSVNTIIGIFAILKTGSAYVPIANTISVNRLEAIIENGKINLLLRPEGGSISLSEINAININENINVDKKKTIVKCKVTHSDLAYVFYTSGSTGIPKGVKVEHGSVVNLITWFVKEFSIDSNTKILQTTDFTFDPSIEDVFGSLTAGGSFYIADKESVLDVGEFSRVADEFGITMMNTVPSLLKELLAGAKVESLKTVISGGESLDIRLKENLLAKGYNLYNNYGPTETTVDCLSDQCLSSESISLGKPIANTKVYILDKYNEMVPQGVTGEMCIAGDCLSQGYLGDEILTSEKFITIHGERIYKTGDIGKWNKDGKVEYLGRVDNQVKIRGYRIELGEVENALLKHEYIKDGVVIDIEENRKKYLCAYIVKENDFNVEEIRTYLSLSLPDYMIPSYFVELDSLPLNNNGKINRKVLPYPEIKVGGDYVAPSNEIEEKLVKIWSEVLDVPQEEISTTANFFAIGGHSLKATVLTTNIHKEIGVDFPLREVFLNTSIKAQASQIETSAKKEFVSIPKAKEQSNYLLSPAQKRLYILQQFDLTSTAYNMPFVISLGKEDDKSKIEEVFKKLINRHESFRTSIIAVEGEPVQLISKDIEFKVEELTIENTEVENIRNKFIKPFDLSKAPFLRVAIVNIKGEDSLLMIDMHHIISDGISHQILEQEFQALFSGEELAPLPLQYKDYSQWQNSKEQQEFIKNQEQYWLNKFEGEIPILNLPLDYVRPSMQSHEGATVSFVLSKEETEGIRIFTKENDLTLYMSLLSVFSILLSKLSGQDDIIVGTPIAGRNHADLENIVGMFINTLSIRNVVKAEATIEEFVSSLKQTVLGAYENQNYQFEDVVNKVSVDRDISRNPIFDVVINVLNQAEQSGDLSGIDNENLIHKKGVSKFDLTLSANDYDEQLLISFNYCTQLFKAETIDRFIEYFKKIVNQLTRKPKVKISEIDILTREEKHRLLYEFNNTEVDYPNDKTIHRLFEGQVERTPDNVALVCGNQFMTYKELNERSNQFARYLIGLNGKEQGVIGILYESSIELYIGIFGILKAGKAYLPIDNSLPDSRIQFMLKDSCIETIFIGNTTKEYLNHKNICIDNVYTNDINVLDSGNLDTIDQASGVAYIIYTSGSTGLPKGTIVEHSALVNLCFGHNEFYKINSTDRISKYAGFGFDASVWETFPGLIKGASLYVIDEEIKTDSQKLNEYFHKKDITISFLPTQFCENFMEYENNSLRVLLTGGDKLNYYKQRKYKLFNNYGPTENTVVTSRYEVIKTEANIPIGKPIENCTVFIVNRFNKLQPIGVAGELCISGYGLADGYLNQVELTKEKFISHPFKEGERLYRTGDLARWLPNGNIEFLGRVDHQVKIRGFRIELGEIESVLIKHENIKESTVLAREENNDKYLCAYVVCKEEFNHDELRTYMSAQLPDYMVPSYFVQLDELPLTSNGKVNRKVLPAPVIKAGDDYVAPSNETEEKLAEIWSEVLNIEKEEISTIANFFSIGGHSLNVINVVSAIKEKFGINLPLMHIYRASNIKKIAIDILSKEFASNDFEVYNNENNNKVFCFPPMIGYGLCFAEVARLIPELCFYSFNYINTEDLVKFYTDKIIEADNQGSYKLLGY